MYVHNVRYGFATNSSSCHSVVVLREVVPDDTDGSSFGWAFFTASDLESKRQYLGQCLKSSLSSLHGLLEEDAAAVASSWTGVSVDPEGYVDHQSELSFPSIATFLGLQIDREFFNDFLKYIERKDVAIFGGNDGSDPSEHPYSHLVDDVQTGYVGAKLLTEESPRNLRSRYDSKGKFWAIFNRRTGTKVRLSFEGDASAEKSEAPELVDVKITDFCGSNCAYCYQGSSNKGKPASIERISFISGILRRMGVFEVALGGGEPTSHPQFLQILRIFHKDGILPNFSTRNTGWVKDNWVAIKDQVGAIGFSVNSLKDLKASLQNIPEDCHSRFMAQMVVGACTAKELEKVIKFCGQLDIRLLLLGWKRVGRGVKGPAHVFDLEAVLDKFINDEGRWIGSDLSFDTLLVESMKDWLEKHSEPWFFQITEGSHSMYIDCVQGLMSKSSYDLDGAEPLGDFHNFKSRLLNYFQGL